MTTCPSCHHPAPGRHYVAGKANRCVDCGSPATPGLGRCALCQLKMQRARQAAVAERLAMMDGEDE